MRLSLEGPETKSIVVLPYLLCLNFDALPVYDTYSIVTTALFSPVHQIEFSRPASIGLATVLVNRQEHRKMTKDSQNRYALRRIY